MPYIEGASFCRIEEYTRGEAERIHPPEIVVDEIYMFMLAMKANTEKRAAAKSPTRVNEVVQEDTGLYRVKFDFLDEDFRPTATVHIGDFRDGYWVSPAKDKVTVNAIQPRTGYFKTYDDGIHGGFLERNTDMHSSLASV